MDPRYYSGDDDRDDPPHDVCSECGADVEDDGHDVTCSYHSDYYEQPVRESEPDEVTK